MNAILIFVPPGGGEAHYSLKFKLDAAPNPGDYISIRRPDQEGTSNFVVRRCWWHLDHPTSGGPGISSVDDAEKQGSLNELVVECEFAIGPYSSDSHKRSCEAYKARSGTVIEFDNSCY